MFVNCNTMKCKTSILAFFIMFAWATLSCNSKPPAPEKEAAKAAAPMAQEVKLTAQQMKEGNIQVVSVAEASINSNITLNGVIDVPPQNMVSITCPMGGYIKSINLLPGQEVSQGEVLITMEDPAYIQLQQDYLVSSSRLGFLEKEYARQKDLSVTDATSRKQFEQVASDVQAERATQQALKEKLALIGINAANLTGSNITRSIAIRSPIHGFISKVTVNRGRYVNATETLAELVDPGDIHASLTVFEKDLPRIRKGQKVWVQLVANANRKYPADVLLVMRNLDENKTGLVHCHFDEYSRELVPGMAITAQVELENSQQPAVPQEAVLLYKGKHYVFLENGTHTFRLTEVVPGVTENGLTALQQTDMKWAGQRVVTKGAFNLLGNLMKSEEED